MTIFELDVFVIYKCSITVSNSTITTTTIIFTITRNVLGQCISNIERHKIYNVCGFVSGAAKSGCCC